MKTLYLMRHGETIFNQKLMLQGACDAPLTNLGQEQARIAGNFFTGTSIDKYFCSPLTRAKETLKIVTGDQNLSPVEVPELMEWNFGLLEGENQKIFPSSFPYGDKFVSFGGEDEEEVKKRMIVGVQKIFADLVEGEVALAVAHTCVIRLFLMSDVCHQKVVAPKRIGNCAVVKLTEENGIISLEQVIEHDFSQIGA